MMVRLEGGWGLGVAMKASSYWFHNLEKVQFALSYLRSALAGRDIEQMIGTLERLEDDVTKSLIEAEESDDD